MKFKAFLFSLVISVGSFSYAENHVVSPEFQQDFKIAVKKIEDKKFLEAVEIFEKLASQGVPEAQFNLALLNNNGLGTPKNFKMALYWSWYAHLNGHTTALDQVNSIYGSITEALRDTVANLIIDELLSAANTGDRLSALKLGQTYTGLLVAPAAKQLTVEEILSQQEQASSKFLEINP